MLTGKLLRNKSMEKRILNIILTEDNPALRDVFREAFDAIRMKVKLHTVSNCQKLMMQMNHSQPDLIFLNHQLLESSKMNCLPVLRKNWHDVIIVVYTSDGNEDQLEDVLSNGANVFINKPLEMPVLQMVLEEVCTVSRQYIVSGFRLYNFLMNINGERTYNGQLQRNGANARKVAAETGNR
jgi:DNA-binding response OmpR family regulator